jgi:hypothetical protein
MTSTLAQALREIYGRGDLEALERLYLHRVQRRYGGIIVFGREAVAAMTLEDLSHFGPSGFSVDTDLLEFVATSWQSAKGGTTRRHYWPEFEGDYIARETIVDNNAFRKPPHRAHNILGELNSGHGQTGPAALEGFHLITQRLHNLWNRRQLATFETLYHQDATYQGPRSAGGLDQLRAWRLAQFNDYPQSFVTFEREIVAGDKIALLWQLSRIDKTGTRDRVTGSTLLRLEGERIVHEDTLVDGG